MDVDLTDLRLFLHIVDSGSITAGSRAANLSLAAGSERVSGLEQALGTPLLTRGRRGVLPTAAGLTLTQHAREVLQQADELRQDLQSQARGKKQPVSLIGTSASIREYLPDPLGDFLAQQPLVNVSVTEAASDTSVQAVVTGSADIGFVTERSEIEGLEFFPFVMNRFALVVPRAHPLVRQARGREISEALADGCDVVGLPEGIALQDTWQARAAGRGAALNVRVRVPGFDAQLRLIERGVGVALLPQATAQRGARTMAIEVLPLSDAYLVRQLLICVRRLNTLAPHTQRLVAHLRGAYRAVSPGDAQADLPGAKQKLGLRSRAQRRR